MSPSYSADERLSERLVACLRANGPMTTGELIHRLNLKKAGPVLRVLRATAAARPDVLECVEDPGPVRMWLWRAR